MPDIDLSYLVYDPAVGVSSTEDMTPDLLHKAVKNCLFTAFTWQPCYNSPVALARGITVDVPVILPGAKIEVCTICDSNPGAEGVFCELLDGEESLGAWLSNELFTEPMESVLGGTGSVVVEMVSDHWRQLTLRVTATVLPFTCFYRILGGE